MQDFNNFLDAFSKIFDTDPKLVLVYAVLYFTWGVLMHNFGTWAKIARFKYWWQIITCYLLYMVPISLIIERLTLVPAICLWFIFYGFTRIRGYTLKSSIAFDNNLLDKIFTERNFALCMTLFFAAYFPIGNAVVGWVYKLL